MLARRLVDELVQDGVGYPGLSCLAGWMRLRIRAGVVLPLREDWRSGGFPVNWAEYPLVVIHADNSLGCFGPAGSGWARLRAPEPETAWSLS